MIQVLIGAAGAIAVLVGFILLEGARDHPQPKCQWVVRPAIYIGNCDNRRD